jgi:hypothetical protein
MPPPVSTEFAAMDRGAAVAVAASGNGLAEGMTGPSGLMM